jgi:hypothetical protein
VASILLLLIPPAIGVCAGFAAGGRLGRLASLRFRAGWLLLIAALIQVVQYYSRPVRILFTRDLGVPMLAIVFALVAAWLVVNFLGWSAPLRLAGAAISLGAVLNGLVILLNGRMPYSPAAARQVGLRPFLQTPKNAPAGGGTLLRFLGDIIPVAPLHKIVSLGDVFIVLGGSSLIALAMRRIPYPHQSPRQEEVNDVSSDHAAASALRGVLPCRDSRAALHDRRALRDGRLTRGSYRAPTHAAPAHAGAASCSTAGA